jgi:hypothetical protein
MVQTLSNLHSVTTAVESQLKIAGTALRDHGVLYDKEFPHKLREWINVNCEATTSSLDDISEYSDDMADPNRLTENLDVIITQLIGLRAALEESTA